MMADDNVDFTNAHLEELPNTNPATR